VGPIDTEQLSRCLPKDEDRIQFPKRCVLNKKQDMDNVEKLNNCINILSLQAFKSYLERIAVYSENHAE
jgi:hypothetical protein